MNTNKKHIETGFKTPDNYFDAFENNLFEQLQLEKETGFTAPESYFENLDAILLEKIEQQKKAKVISLINKKQLLYISSIAAALVFAFFIIKPNDTNPLSFDNIEYAEFEDYLNTEELDISPTELADLFEIDTNDLNTLSFVTLENEALLNYLSEEMTSDDYYDNEL